MESDADQLQETESTGTEAATEVETETETDEETEANVQVNTLVGSLVDIDMEQITILSDNGNEIILPISGTELDFRGGFRLGNLVAVTYIGDLTSTDGRACDIVTLRAADSSDVGDLEYVEPETESETETETESETETEAETETETESETETETETETELETEAVQKTKTLRGTLQKLERNTMTILTKDKEEKTFGIVNVQMFFAKGMSVGTKVVVSYQGTFSDEDTTVVSVIDQKTYKVRKAAKKNGGQ
jgi:hypothetical protein